ncbi:hypothetical protein K3G63_21555 [Hymenobacter sp. HSC-4F20]|uniref:hypothetical protein n=1 Tax=Hymenobacter sp. HSC-4F20 TaxID=2864135 RepID=UPI001C7363FC|nr:hypothetical protein [Hymenobacter sp. HSC-4F20]MBX0293045.1 hypothetical protein [Hymenobacter sp. HSC-4F20]
MSTSSVLAGQRPATKRFLTLSPAAQQAVVQALREQFSPQGMFSPVPAAEWLRLLRLTDPLIQSVQGPCPEYRVAEGRLLWELLGHYLDVT